MSRPVAEVLISFLLKNAMGCSSYSSTTPMPTSQASVSTTNGKLKFGYVNTGAEINVCFNFWKASFAAESH